VKTLRHAVRQRDTACESHENDNPQVMEIGGIPARAGRRGWLRWQPTCEKSVLPDLGGQKP
jgi:hypothetical protein